MGIETMNKAVNSKRVFGVKPHRPIGYGEMLGERGDVRLDMLGQEIPDAAALEVLSAAHAYQISSARDELAAHYHVSGELLKKTPSLLIVSTNGAGYDTVTVQDCTDNGVLVVNQAGGNAESVAEHVLGMMLCLAKRVGECDRALRAGTLGDRNNYAGTDELLRRSDFVSINCPLTDETRKMISACEYALMQPHAYFITTARGFIHDEEALERALRDKKIAGAGLDVWAKEPPPADHPLMKFDNVLVTAHTAGVTREARANMGKIAAEQILDALDGKPAPRIVNPQVWPVYAKRFEKAFGFAPQR
jgi:D-3-phosphoglycerate dehydrogenase